MLTVSPAYSGVNVEANTARQLAELFACVYLRLLALCDAGLRAASQAGGMAAAGVLLGV